jgi:hypothetical protein
MLPVIILFNQITLHFYVNWNLSIALRYSKESGQANE